MSAEAVTAWEASTKEYIETFYSDPTNTKAVSAQDVTTDLTVTSLGPPSRRFLMGRFLQTSSDQVQVTYSQLLNFNPTVSKVDVEKVASYPFDSGSRLVEYLAVLQNSGNSALAKVTKVSEVTIPVTPNKGGGSSSALSTGAIIGIAVGGAVVLVILMCAISKWVLYRSSKHSGYVGDVEDAPPTSIRAGQDDVSTMDGYSKVRSSRESLAGYGDQR